MLMLYHAELPVALQDRPVTADDLGVGGALAVLMKDAIMPTLMQVGPIAPCTTYVYHVFMFTYLHTHMCTH